MLLVPTIFLIFIQLTSAAGVRVQIRQPVIESLKRAVLPKLISTVVGTKIDDFRFSKFGAECHSSNFFIQNFEIRSNVDLTFNNGQACLRANNIYLALRLHMTCKAFFIQSSGDAKIHLSTNEFVLYCTLHFLKLTELSFDRRSL